LLVARRLWNAAKTKTKIQQKEPKISSTVEPSKTFWRPSKPSNAPLRLNIVSKYVTSTTLLQTEEGIRTTMARSFTTLTQNVIVKT
jgi:hypothetical protein